MTTTRTLVKPLADLRGRMVKHKSTAIAKASGVHINTVRAIRNGVNLNPTLSVIERIATALDSMEGVEHD